MGDLAIFLIALLLTGSVMIIAYLIFSPVINKQSKKSKRIAAVTGAENLSDAERKRQADKAKSKKQREVEAALKEAELKEKNKFTLEMRIAQAGLSTPVPIFLVLSVFVGLACGFGVLIAGLNKVIAIGAVVVGGVALPMFFLARLRKKRQLKFIDELANAVDVIVRGLKAGLPVNECFKVIAQESPDPVGPEFQRVVEGQKVGIAIDQGITRMYQRMPLPEVNFLSIVINIQQKTGGNLGEALSNLAKVLRDRKQMKAKVLAMSQEAKSSAAIIGCLPFLIIAAVYALAPHYIGMLFDRTSGNLILAGCGLWMVFGVLVMRKMIDFDI